MSENKQYTLEEVTAFLCGEAPLDGFWFGDERPIDRGAFWWRKHLRVAVLSASAGEKKDAERLEFMASDPPRKLETENGMWRVYEDKGDSENYFYQAITALFYATPREAIDEAIRATNSMQSTKEEK